jgi:hypothetical protein
MINKIYINTETMEFPIYVGDIKLLYPNIDVSTEFVLPPEFQLVYVPEPSELSTNQYFVETQPKLIDGKWTYIQEIREYTESELENKRKASERYKPQSGISVPNITPERIAEYHKQHSRPVLPAGKRKIFPTEATGKIEVTVI